jgi:hypothetical protein
MLALNNKGDIEFAISMFEKAITWYPENERLLEEWVTVLTNWERDSDVGLYRRTLNLKRRLREERGIPEPARSSKGKAAANPLRSTRLGNSRTAPALSSATNKPRRPLFDPDVDGPAVGIKQPEAKENKKKSTSKKDETSKKAEVVNKGQGSRKGKTKSRPVLEAAAAAFADSSSEDEGSEDEVEKSLVIDEEVESPVKKGKGKGKAVRGKKRKSDADDDDYVAEEIERPSKRSRRPIFWCIDHLLYSFETRDSGP